MSSQGGTSAPCRERPECNHKKHGFTRKDRPAPKPRVRAKGQPMAGWDHTVCACLVKQAPVEEAAA